MHPEKAVVPPNETTSDVARQDSQAVCLNSFKQHWAEAQIDGPMHAIARYDDVAKLLITIGGFLLAVLASGYSTMLRELHGQLADGTRAQAQVVFYSMLVFFVSAAAVCFPQVRMRAGEILALRGDHDLTAEIHDWCVNIGRVAILKKIFLGVATAAFIVSFLVMMHLLLSVM